MTNDLAPWLLEQIAEDERRLAPMMATFPDEPTLAERGWLERNPAIPRFPDALTSSDVMSYMIDMGPARLLAECDAKRRLVELHEPERGHCSTCLETDSDLYGKTYETAPCMNLRLLALPYVDRDGYDEEWRP